MSYGNERYRERYSGAYRDGYTATEGATVVTLLELDLSSPAQQTFGSTATSGDVLPARAADDVFLMDDSGAQVSSVAAESLAVQGSVTTQRIAPGFFDGTNMVGKLGCQVSVEATAAGWESAGNTFWDVTTESFLFLGLFRMRPGSSSGTRLFTKLGGLTGYNLSISNIGRLSWLLDPGTAQNVLNTGNQRDGTWQPFVAGRDQSAVRAFVRTLGFDGDNALTATGSMTVASPFQLGEPDASNAAAAQWAFLARFSDADSEGVSQADLISWYTHGAAPSGLTYARTGNIWTVVDDDATFGLIVAPWSANQVPTAYRAGLTTGRGTEFQPAVTNLADTDIATNWTHTTITPTALTADSPDRFDDAHLLTATAANSTSHYDMTTVASTVYAGGFFYRRSGGSDVTFDIEMQRTDTSAVLATAELTATSKWQRASITAAAATTTTRLLARVITNTEAVEIWHPQFHVGTYMRGVVGAYTAAGGTSSAPAATIDNSGNVFLDSVRGEVEIVCIKDGAPTADEMLLSVRGAIDDDDRLDVKILADDTLQVTINNSAGTLVGTATTGAITWTTEQTIRVRWNSADPISGYAQHMDVLVNGSRTASDISSAWTPGPGGDEIHVGHAYDGSDPLSAVVSSVNVFETERAD